MSVDRKREKINTKDIIVNPLAQRDVESRKAQFNKIMRTFDPDLVNPVKLAVINGKHYCFDGQMTMKVLKARNKGKDLAINCECYYGLTELDMANLFVQQNGTVSKVKEADKLRVMANFGDEESVAIVNLTERNGLEISWNGGKRKNAIIAVSTLRDVFREINGLGCPDVFGEFIRVVKEAWDGDPDSLASKILYGVGIFVKTYYGQYDHDRLVKKLREKLPKDIIRDAQIDRSSGMRKYAVQILQVYNGSLRNPLPNKL